MPSKIRLFTVLSGGSAGTRSSRVRSCLIAFAFCASLGAAGSEGGSGAGAKSAESGPEKGAAESSPAEKSEQPPSEENTEWWNGDYALTGWNGARARLAQRGVYFEFRYSGELRSNTSGGINTDDSTHYLGNVNASVDLFTDKLKLYDGGEFYLRFENVHGQGISQHQTGDIQLLSSIDAPAFNQISELFYRHSILDDRLHFKIGKQDGSGDFIAPKYGIDFTHSAFGCISNIPLPRFSIYAPAAVISFDAYKWMTFAAGVYDGDFQRHALGLEHPFQGSFHDFTIAEFLFKPELIKDHETIIRAGAWHQRADLPLIGALNTDGTADLRTRFKQNDGAYLEYEQSVYHRPAPKDGEKKDDDPQAKARKELVAPGTPEPLDQGLAVFAQLSYEPDNRNDQPRYFGGGVFYKGLFKGRDDDRLGVGVASVGFSQRLHPDHKTYEAAIETFYKIQTTPFSSFQPDLQYILHPGGFRPNATTVGFRYQISF